MSLPIDAVLPQLMACLDTTEKAVLVAPPGAGKTTRVPLALLDAKWRGDQRIILVEPRRLAARAAAARMASTLGEAVGERVGYRVRMDAKISARTRIEVVTEGVFTRMVVDDPSLEGIGAVIFDEFHERSLDGDLGLALALDGATALRPDLRILVMSATLDGARVARLLGDCPVVESEGRAYPVDTRYIPRDPLTRFEDQMAEAILAALRADPGSILAFLPGQGEIQRVAERLKPKLPAGVLLAPLYGALSSQDQDRAISPAPVGQRKIVLATSIAETSLTIEGIRIVVDGGLARVPRYEPATGLTRLETVRVSRAASDQRRGRAGRTEPGICWRLWSEAQTSGLEPFARPEILDSDLSGLALDLAACGIADPASLAFLDPPPKPAWSEAVKLLTGLNALDQSGHITADGRALSRLPLHPRLAHMILSSPEAPRVAADIAAILSEPSLGGNAVDLAERLRRFRQERGPRADEARRMVGRWLQLSGLAASPDDAGDPGRILARAYPDRIAEARGARGAFRLANGRGGAMAEHEALARASYIVVADLTGSAERATIRLAAELDRADLEADFASAITSGLDVSFDRNARAVRARRQRRLGALLLADDPVAAPADAATRQALLSGISSLGIDRLPWSRDQKALRGRVSFLRRTLGDSWPNLSDEGLAASLHDWLGPFVDGISRVDDIDAALLGQALDQLLPYAVRQEVDRQLPSHFTAPTGNSFVIDYDAEGGPAVSLRVQELFGLTRHPAVASGKLPLTLILLSPAHRPIQTTRDLPGFWAGSWKDVAKDLKGRYPRHLWPDDPANAAPTARAKPRGT